MQFENENDAIPSAINMNRLRFPTWLSDCCCQNKGECDLNQSNVNSFVKSVARNNSKNNDDRHKIHKIFLINCFVFVITVVSKTAHGLVIAQITVNSLEKTLQLFRRNG